MRKEAIFVDYTNTRMVSWFLKVYDKDKFRYISDYVKKDGTPIGSLWEPIGLLFGKKMVKEAAKFHDGTFEAVVDSKGNIIGGA